jgi:hypothetical protein
VTQPFKKENILCLNVLLDAVFKKHKNLEFLYISTMNEKQKGYFKQAQLT